MSVWAGLLGAPVPAFAQEPASAASAPQSSPSRAEVEGRPRLEWGDRPRFNLAESLSTGIAATGLVVLHFAELHREGDPWTARFAVDESARGGLRAPTADGRTAAARASDVLMYGLMFYPVVIDTGLVALGIHRSPDVAAQMFLINAQAFALSSLVTVVTKLVARRERPYGRNCGPGSDTPGCDDEQRYKSFYSGHTSTAFTGAGLVCAHHLHLPLYGDEGTGMAACGLAVGAAATVGTMRVVADKHYLSDVLLGAGVGLLSGYLMPRLLHYRDGRRPPRARDRRVRSTVAPMLGLDSAGLSVQGLF